MLGLAISAVISGLVAVSIGTRMRSLPGAVAAFAVAVALASVVGAVTTNALTPWIVAGAVVGAGTGLWLVRSA